MTTSFLHFTTSGVERQFMDFGRLKTKEMRFTVFVRDYALLILPPYTVNLNPEEKNCLNQLLKKANIQSRTLRCQLRLSYTIHFDACQTDNSRQNAQSRKCRSVFMGV